MFSLAIVALGCAFASADRAFVVAQKRITSSLVNELVVVGRPFSVVYTLKNAGAEPAYKVSLTDTWPADHFVVVDGSGGAVNASWEVLEPEAIVSTTIVVKPKTTGVLTSPGASVSYSYKSVYPEDEAGDEEDDEDDAAEEDDEETVSSISSDAGRVEILSEAAYQKASTHKELHYSIGGLILVLIIGFSIAKATTADAGSSAKKPKAAGEEGSEDGAPKSNSKRAKQL